MATPAFAPWIMPVTLVLLFALFSVQKYGTDRVGRVFGPVMLLWFNDQMALYNEVLGEFRRHRAALLGISVDSAWCHAAFAQHRRLHFPLLADFEPKGAVARSYGAYRAKDGVAEPAQEA